MIESKVVTIAVDDNDALSVNHYLDRYTAFGWFVVSTSSKRVKLEYFSRPYAPRFENVTQMFKADYGDEHVITLNREKNTPNYSTLSANEGKFNQLYNEYITLKTQGGYAYIEYKEESIFSESFQKYIRLVLFLMTFGLSYVLYYRKHPMKSKLQKKQEDAEYNIANNKAKERIQEIKVELVDLLNQSLNLLK
jgi:hypothetical protein